jgi:hypothetical protein
MSNLSPVTVTVAALGPALWPGRPCKHVHKTPTFNPEFRNSTDDYAHPYHPLPPACALLRFPQRLEHIWDDIRGTMTPVGAPMCTAGKTIVCPKQGGWCNHGTQASLSGWNTIWNIDVHEDSSPAVLKASWKKTWTSAEARSVPSSLSSTCACQRNTIG